MSDRLIENVDQTFSIFLDGFSPSHHQQIIFIDAETKTKKKRGITASQSN